MGDSVLIKGDMVRALRLRKGWTSSDLAKACGFAQITRTRINRGGPLSIRTVRRLAEVLGVGVADLLTESVCHVEERA